MIKLKLSGGLGNQLFQIAAANHIAHMLNINLNSRPSDLSPEIYFKLTEIFEKNTKA